MKIAITGPIGSGKSYVCRELARRGIKVYDCDAAAKRLMREDHNLQKVLQTLVGEEVYREGRLQKAVLARFILSGEEKKQAVNDVVHPAVAKDFERSGIDWLESAILYESCFYRRTHLDYIVCVTAPEEVRIQRVMERDHIDRDKALQWINAQMEQETMAAMSDYVIVNDGEQDIAIQAERILEDIKRNILENKN